MVVVGVWQGRYGGRVVEGGGGVGTGEGKG